MVKKKAKVENEGNSRAPKNSANAHDKRYKRLFSNPLIVEELMKCFVELDFVNDLDYSTLELQEKASAFVR